MSRLVLAEILGAFVDTFLADAKYPVEYYKNLRLPIQMQLSEKRKPFPEIFVRFQDSKSNFKHFEKKHDGHSSCVSEITDVEKRRQTTL